MNANRPVQKSLFGANGESPARRFLQRYYVSLITGAEILIDCATIFLCLIAGSCLFMDLHNAASNSVSLKDLRLAVLATPISFLIFERIGLYRRQMSMMNLIEVRKIIQASMILFFVLLAFLSLTHFSFSRIALLYGMALAMFFLIVERMIFFKLHQYLHRRGFHVRRVVIFGACETGRLLYQSIRQAPKLGYYGVGFFDENLENLEVARDWFVTGVKSDPLLVNDLETFAEVVRREHVSEIFMSTPLHDDEHWKLEQVVQICRELGILLSFIPYMHGFFAEQVQVNDVNGIPMISFRNVPVSRAEQFSKRLFDFLLATLALVITAPLFLAAAIAIRRDSEGPILFRQERVGKDGELFEMYKFRTMYVDTPDYGKTPRSSRDPRITKVGRFLRKTSLDELPQLFNVISGDMSLVGPRPEMRFIVENEYNDLHRERLRVKPGITGVWQISADRKREIHENISYDIFYIANRSLLLDIIILVRTVLFGILSMKTS